jgi:glucans biosynthesis protein C
MDALRACSMLLLVPVHAASLLAINGRPGVWVTAIVWPIHVFRLPLFFAMSGFFFFLLVGRRGVPATLRNRTLRIAVPLVLALLTLAPLFLLASEATGVSVAGVGVATTGSPFRLRPSYLWFLWYLLIIDMVAFSAAVFAPGAVRRAAEGLGALLARPALWIAVLAVPAALALWPSSQWYAAPANSFVPDPQMLAYYGLFFAFGALISSQSLHLDRFARNGWRSLTWAVLLVVPAAALFSLHDWAIADGGAEGAAVHAGCLLFYCATTWACLIALVGLTHRYLTRPRPALRYMADSSYWIYLSHLPAMVLTVALVGTWAIGTPASFAIITAVSLAFSLVTYPLLVRYTAIGRLLNGRRTRPRLRSRAAAQAARAAAPVSS